MNKFADLMKKKRELMMQLDSAKITLGQDEKAVQRELDEVNHELKDYLKKNVGREL